MQYDLVFKFNKIVLFVTLVQMIWHLPVKKLVEIVQFETYFDYHHDFRQLLLSFFFLPENKRNVCGCDEFKIKIKLKQYSQHNELNVFFLTVYVTIQCFFMCK